MSIDKGLTVRNMAATVLAVLLLATMVTVLGPAAPAQATCGDWQETVSYDYTTVEIYNMAAAEQKQDVGCYDGNVRYSSKSTRHRGQWFSNGGVWYWSSVGSKWINSGTQSPVVTMIAGSITVGRYLRIGTVSDGWGQWWF